ncbi:hypothetical protein STCU_12310 [Strigomonas culicis]|uniref:Endonuclease/exonuclease/phosphatase domain-containing protein n=1 Tax=Strigomonas culicis TaxID=28005 RepID=S9TFR0_9TRYP|nr:hypothetical protein STCU_12310 [Strigomonas culicis]|eukprot:EPY15153.1 hypothetical protein STCU_12310 [Strigomonas culicis]
MITVFAYYRRLFASRSALPDVIALQETHVWTPQDAADFQELGYSVAACYTRPDSRSRVGGGVVTLFRDATVSAVEYTPTAACPVPEFEQVMVWVRDKCTSPATYYGIVNCYWRPNCLASAQPVESVIEFYSQQGMDIVVGDMNARHLSWSSQHNSYAVGRGLLDSRRLRQ